MKQRLNVLIVWALLTVAPAPVISAGIAVRDHNAAEAAHQLRTARLAEQQERARDRAEERMDQAEAKVKFLEQQKQALDAQHAQDEQTIKQQQDKIDALNAFKAQAQAAATSGFGGGGVVRLASAVMSGLHGVLGPIGNSYAPGFCTYFVASWRSVPNNWGDAGQWLWHARAAGWSTGSMPQVGAIEVSWASRWGHVMLVEQVYSSDRWLVSEMNFNGWWVIDTRLVTRATEPLAGFIY